MNKWEGWTGDDRLQAHCDKLNGMDSARSMGWTWFVGERNGKREIMRKDGPKS